jgi:hypothetical protein
MAKRVRPEKQKALCNVVGVRASDCGRTNDKLKARLERTLRHWNPAAASEKAKKNVAFVPQRG